MHELDFQPYLERLREIDKGPSSRRLDWIAQFITQHGYPSERVGMRLVRYTKSASRPWWKFWIRVPKIGSEVQDIYLLRTGNIFWNAKGRRFTLEELVGHYHHDGWVVDGAPKQDSNCSMLSGNPHARMAFEYFLMKGGPELDQLLNELASHVAELRIRDATIATVIASPATPRRL